MSDYRIIKRIGSRWREESRDVVEAALPERLHELVDRIAARERPRAEPRAVPTVEIRLPSVTIEKR